MSITSRSSGFGASPRTLYRRYFRGQNLVLDQPLRQQTLATVDLERQR
jgi:hypothetical protein